MKKKNLFIAVLAMLMVCVMMFVCVSCGKSDVDTNNNTNIEQTTPDIENENNPGSENSNQNGGSVENEESTTPDNSGDVDNSDNTDNGSENTGDDNSSDDNNVNNPDNNEDVNDDTDGNNKLVGIGLYVCANDATFPYYHGQKINGVINTLDDGTTMYQFGKFESIYVVDANKIGRYNNYWDLNCMYSSKFVYCKDILQERKNGTFFSGVTATYANMSGQDLTYYIGKIYQSNNGCYLVVNSEPNVFKKDTYVILDEPVYVKAGDVDVAVEISITLDTQMLDGIQNEIEFVFYDMYGNVVSTKSYNVRTIPNEIVWQDNYDKVIISEKYNGTTSFTITETRGDLVYVNMGYDWNTVINNVGYHHHISWILEN